MARDHFIKLTFGNKIEEFIDCDGSGSPPVAEATNQTDSPKASVVHAARMVLPNMISGSDIFESPRYINIPSVIEPVNETDERNILEHLIEDLNILFHCDLAPMCNVAHDNVPIEDDPGIVLAGKRFVLCGASHMSRLANVFEDYGALVVDLSVPGWRASATNVEEMAGQLSSVLSKDFSGETLWCISCLTTVSTWPALMDSVLSRARDVITSITWQADWSSPIVRSSGSSSLRACHYYVLG
jgi:hypothetical protein